MNNWMRRRIERSRTRCEKFSAGRKRDKSQASEKQARPNAGRTLKSTAKGN